MIQVNSTTEIRTYGDIPLGAIVRSIHNNAYYRVTEWFGIFWFKRVLLEPVNEDGSSRFSPNEFYVYFLGENASHLHIKQ